MLPWDTTFFGVRTARLTAAQLTPHTLATALHECGTERVQVIHCLADGDDDGQVLLLEQAGFHLVDIRITLRWQGMTPPPNVHSTTLVLRNHREDDITALAAIARNSYYQTRYYYDRNYPRERCDALYAEWIIQSCQGGAERVVVAERDRQALGYVTCQRPAGQEEGQIGLVGIRSDARGTGLGQLMVRESLRWFVEEGVRVVTVVTQGRNLSAQRLYQRCGFVTDGLQLWYHKWLKQLG
jgi:dTDP-4-amino-4,6-dideoxy-D-galactose acyltransferase